MAIYARAGVEHLWLGEPLLRTLEVYWTDRGRWLVLATHGGDDVGRAEPFGDVEIALGRLWLPCTVGASPKRLK